MLKTLKGKECVTPTFYRDCCQLMSCWHILFLKTCYWPRLTANRPVCMVHPCKKACCWSTSWHWAEKRRQPLQASLLRKKSASLGDCLGVSSGKFVMAMLQLWSADVTRDMTHAAMVGKINKNSISASETSLTEDLITRGRFTLLPFSVFIMDSWLESMHRLWWKARAVAPHNL